MGIRLEEEGELAVGLWNTVGLCGVGIHVGVGHVTNGFGGCHENHFHPPILPTNKVLRAHIVKTVCRTFATNLVGTARRVLLLSYFA
jgi:hypothetical protein